MVIINESDIERVNQSKILGGHTDRKFNMMMISQFNAASTPKGSYRVKSGDNDCNVNSSHYSLRFNMECPS